MAHKETYTGVARNRALVFPYDRALFVAVALFVAAAAAAAAVEVVNLSSFFRSSSRRLRRLCRHRRHNYA